MGTSQVSLSFDLLGQNALEGFLAYESSFAPVQLTRPSLAPRNRGSCGSHQPSSKTPSDPAFAGSPPPLGEAASLHEGGVTPVA